MTSSPMLTGLKRRFASRPGVADPLAYRAFTTDFDEQVAGADLSALYPLAGDAKASFDEASRRFDTLFTAERLEIAASGGALVRDLRQQMPEADRQGTVISFLIDHSGSMRGLRMVCALLAVEGAVDALNHAGITTEILGFTTAGWKGGKSRQAWEWAGRPKNPGRLCDLRHIVYAAAGQRPHFPWYMRLALRADLLHENIDGEALAWAAGRLDAGRWRRRVICLISDGAPVDDSTLLANDDRELLTRHLDATRRGLAEQGFTIGTLLIGSEHVPEPALFERAEEPQATGLSLLQLVRRALLG